MRSRPSIIKVPLNEQISKIFLEALSHNQDVSIEDIQLEDLLSANELLPFKKLSISTLLPVQELAYRICAQPNKLSRVAIQYPTGQGKTSVCFAVGIYLARQGKQVIVLNESDELTFRD